MRRAIFSVWVVLLIGLPSLAAELNDGLVLHLPLTQDLKDHSTAAQRVEVVGKVHIDSDGAAFEGRRDWLEAPHIPLNNRPFAIALWVRSSTPHPTIGLVEQFDQNRPRRHLALMLRNNRNPYFGFHNLDLFTTYRTSTNSEWVHLVFQYDGKQQQIWVNGRYMCRRQAPAYEGDYGVTTIGKMPRWGDVPGRDFIGHMRDFRIYHRVLDHKEIGLLAGITKQEPTEKTTRLAQISIPTLNKSAQESREAAAQYLSPDTSLPFLEIADKQIIINGRAGQVYTLQASADLNNWKALTRMTNQTGRLVYEDKDRQFTPMQFFRVKVEGFEP